MTREEAQEAIDDIATLAKHLGGGEGLEKLIFLLFLTRFDDDVAETLANAGGILCAAKIVTSRKGEPAGIDSVLVNKALRFYSVLLHDGVDRTGTVKKTRPWKEFFDADGKVVAHAFKICREEYTPAKSGEA